MDNSSEKVEIQNIKNKTLNILNDTKTNPLIANKTSNLNSTHNINNKTSNQNSFNNYNNTEFNISRYHKNISKISNNSKPLSGNNIEAKPHKRDNNDFLLHIEFIAPICLILLILLIYYCIKKRVKSKSSKIENYNLEQNRNKLSNSGNKQPYNRIQNTSGFNNNLGINPNNLSEIKVKNMKEEINKIINSSGSSSGRRRREKKKSNNNNIMGFEGKESKIGIQNEIKEQIKKIVADEHNNNS